MRVWHVATVTTIMMLTAACSKKKAPGQFSTWYVNNDTFVTNEVIMSIDRNGSNLSSAGKENGFELYSRGVSGINEAHLGTYILSADYESGNPELEHAYFYYKGSYYQLLPGQADTLTITRPAGKYRYTLQPGWFINGVDASDSILISGVFNEP